MADNMYFTDLDAKITRDKLVEAGVLVKNNYAATGAPTVNDDETDGYEIGSEWINGTTLYKCMDASEGEADWDTVTTS